MDNASEFDTVYSYYHSFYLKNCTIAWLITFTNSYLINICAIAGDMLLAAGVIAYLGAFTPEFRGSHTEMWLEECKARGVPCSDQFGLSFVS